MRKYKKIILCSIGSGFKIGEYQAPYFINNLKMGNIIKLPLGLRAYCERGESLFSSGTYLVDKVGSIEEKLILELQNYDIKEHKDVIDLNIDPCSVIKVENNLMNKIKEEVYSLRR